MKSIEERLKLVEQRLDNLESQSQRLDTRTSGLQIIGGAKADKYKNDPNIDSFTLKYG